MKILPRLLVVTGISVYLLLINQLPTTAASGQDIKGGVLEGQAFTEEVTSNLENSKKQAIDSVEKEQALGADAKPGKLEVRSISPDAAADEINGFFGGAYKLVSKISPQGFVVAIILLVIGGPFIGNFFARLVLSVLCYFVIQKAPFIVGVFQGLLSN